METENNDYSYAYEAPTNGHAKCNCGFEGENGYTTPQLTTAIPVSTSCEDPTPMKSNGCKRLALCCSLLFIICLLCLVAVVILWLVTPLQVACDCEPSLLIENCPADFIFQEPAFCGTIPVIWNEPSATDGCDGDVRVEKSHTPGNDLPVGATTVTYTFTDSQEHQMSCQFDISVSSVRIEDDDIRPRVSDCPEHIYEVLQPGQTSMAISWDQPTARDGSGLPVTLHQTHTPGDQFTVGGYELVKYTFTDVAGNEAVCEFAITLYPNGGTVDTTPPTRPSACGYRAGDVTVYAEAGSTTADYNVVWSPATDNDGQTPTIITTHEEGVYSFPLGKTIIYGYYYDSSGNRASCYRTIIVRYTGTSPVQLTVKNCPVNVYREIPEGTTTRVCWDEPEFTDEAGNPPRAGSRVTNHPGAEFLINVAYFVQYIFYHDYRAESVCAFSVTIRAIGHENLPGEWTRWHDADNPSGYCDCETRDGQNVPFEPCATGEPVDVECETVTGDDWRSVGLIPSIPEKKGQVAYCSPDRGFYCENHLNVLYNQRCLDYRARFRCPLPTS